MAGKKILMLSGEFSEEHEICVLQQGVEAVGHTDHVVCPDEKAGKLSKTSLHDVEGDQTYTKKPGHHFALKKTFAEVDTADYDAVYVAGGREPEYIRIYNGQLVSAKGWPGLAAFMRECLKVPGTAIRHG